MSKRKILGYEIVQSLSPYESYKVCPSCYMEDIAKEPGTLEVVEFTDPYTSFTCEVCYGTSYGGR